MNDAVSQLVASGGILGTVLVILGYAYHRQSQVLTAVQEARVADAQKVAQTLLDMQDKWAEALGELTDAVNRLNLPPSRR